MGEQDKTEKLFVACADVFVELIRKESEAKKS